MGTTLVHFGICTRDLGRAVKWYVEHFGFAEVKRFEKAELQIKGALLSLGASSLEILEPLKPAMAGREGNLVNQLQKLGANHFALSVDDVKACYAGMKKLELPYLSEMVDGRFFFCKDPDGTLLEVRQG